MDHIVEEVAVLLATQAMNGPDHAALDWDVWTEQITEDDRVYYRERAEGIVAFIRVTDGSAQ